MKKPKRPRDVNQLAYHVVQVATGQIPRDEPPKPKNPAAVALGKLGASKGGKARAAKLTPLQRKKIAQKAAFTRWGKS